MKKRLSVFLILVIIVLTTASCTIVSDEDNYLTEEKVFTPPDKQIIEVANKGLESMEKVSENKNFEFWVNKYSSEFCIKDLKNQQIHFSNPQNIESDKRAADKYKDTLRSQLVVNFYTPTNSPSTMNSYSDSFLLGQTSVKKIKNGIRVEYQLGIANPQKAYPQIIRASELEKIISKLEDDEARDIEDAYRRIEIKELSKRALSEMQRKYTNISKYDPVYELRAKLGIRLRNDIEQHFKKAGYSPEKAATEQDIIGYISEEEETASFFIPVTYTIDENSFKAEILSNEIQYVKGFDLIGISLIPFFACADTNQSGYMIVPDGSGALINLNSNLSGESKYSADIYGSDLALQYSGKEFNTPVVMPIFGMKTDDSAVLGIVEQGEANGQIEAVLSGGSSSNNSVGAILCPKKSDFLDDMRNTSSSNELVFQKTISKESFTVRYLFFGKNTSYVEMANEYGNFLKQNNFFKSSTNIKHDFFVELVGAIEKEKQLWVYLVLKLFH